MRKNSEAPRKLYVRAGITHVCFEGRIYGAPSDSSISQTTLVRCNKLESDGGRARIEVSTRGGIREIWRSTSFGSK